MKNIIACQQTEKLLIDVIRKLKSENDRQRIKSYDVRLVIAS